MKVHKFVDSYRLIDCLSNSFNTKQDDSSSCGSVATTSPPNYREREQRAGDTSLVGFRLPSYSQFAPGSS